MLSAADLHRRGLEATNAGRNGEAKASFRRALKRDPDAELTARIMLSLAYVEFELGSTDDALALCEQALALPDTSDQTRGLIQSQLGIVHTNAGNASEAQESFGRALDLLDGSPEPQATALLNRGNIHMQRGDVRAALDDLGAAMQIADDAGLEVIRAKAEHNYGYSSMLSGDISGALQHMDRARPILEDLSPMFRAVCAQDRAEVLVAAGLVTDAEEALREAARAYGSRGLRQRQAEAELALAKLMLRQNPREAWRIARQAARRFRGRGSDTWAMRAEVIAVGSALATERTDPGFDVDELARALAAQGLMRDAKVATLEAVQLDVVRHRLGEASSRLAQFDVTEDERLEIRLLHRETQVLLASRQGEREQAMEHARSGLAALHDWQSTFGSLDLQSSLVGHGRGLALQGLGLALDDGRPEVVFEWSERARALASRVTPVRLPVDDAAAEELAELRGLQSEIEGAEAAGAVPRSLLDQAHQVRNSIRERAWHGQGSGSVTEPASLGDVTGVLDSVGGILVSYLVIDERLYALVVAGETPHVIDLGSFAAVRSRLEGMQADLDMAAARLPSALHQTIQQSLAARLAQLAERLVQPIQHRLGDGPLVIVPAGSLAGVPWTLLPGFAGRPLTVPRSATTWAMSEADRFKSGSAGFVAGPRVDRAAEEVARSIEMWSGAEGLVGADATAERVSQLASDVDVFHVAAHGRHSADNPLFSGIELVDGPWFGYDIDQLGSIPSTVILSACEVGRSSVRWGEETIGMTVAWLHAGARCVIASPALVNDDAACEVLAATHQRIAAGDPPSMALAAATTAVSTDHPAPFICFGSGW